jgi:hypothetical protein
LSAVQGTFFLLDLNLVQQLRKKGLTLVRLVFEFFFYRVSGLLVGRMRPSD